MLCSCLQVKLGPLVKLVPQERQVKLVPQEQQVGGEQVLNVLMPQGYRLFGLLFEIAQGPAKALPTNTVLCCWLQVKPGPQAPRERQVGFEQVLSPLMCLG